MKKTVLKKAAALFAAGVFCISMGLSACAKEPVQLDVPVVHGMKGTDLVWQGVEGASGYAVSVNGDEADAAGTTYALSGMEEPGDYTLMVKAVAGDEAHLDSEWSAPLRLTRLAAPQPVVKEGALSWGSVPDSAGYEVFLNGESVGKFDAGTTEYTLGKTAQGDEFAVRALGNGVTVLDSALSDAVKAADDQGAAALGVPKDLRYMEGSLRWGEVPGADSYVIDIEGQPSNLTAKTNRYDISGLAPGKYNATVWAVDKNGVTGAEKANLAFTVSGKNGGDAGGASGGTGSGRLSAVTGAAIGNDTLTWQGVKNAAGYVITVTKSDGTVKKILTAGAATADLGALWLEDGTYQVTITAKGGGGYSDSAPVSLTYWRGSAAPAPVVRPTPVPTGRPTPTPTSTPTPTPKPDLGNLQNVSITAGTLQWDALANAAGYVITVNGQAYNVPAAGPYSFDLTALNLPAGNYPVAIYAAGGANYNNSPTVTVTYVVTKLATPANIAYDLPMETLSWTAVPGATGYVVTFGARPAQTVNTNSCGITGVTPGTYAVTVQAVSTDPNVRPSDNGTLSYTRPKYNLGALQNVRIEAGLLKWDALANATSYEVKVLNASSQVVAGPTTIAVAGPLQYDIYALGLALDSYTVTLQAKGNANYNDSAVASTPYTEKMIRDLTQRANFNYNYPGEPQKYWIQDYCDFSLKQGMTFDMPGTFVEADLNTAYYTFLTAADGSANKNAAAALIGNDVIVSYFYMDGATPTPLITPGGVPLIKNKIWDGWLWRDNGTEYVTITGTVPSTSIGGVVPAETPLRVSSNIARGASGVVDSIISYELDLIAGKTLYVQVDVIYKDGANVQYYRETSTLPIQAYPAP